MTGSRTPDHTAAPQVSLHRLRAEDAEAHVAGEDEATARWLSGGVSSVAGTRDYFEFLAANAAAGTGKQGYGVWLGDRLAGYIDHAPASGAGVEPGDVNIAYGTHPWARGQGVAVEAVHLVCALLRSDPQASRAVLLTDLDNVASARVAEKAGFRSLGEVMTDEGPMRQFILDLRPPPLSK